MTKSDMRRVTEDPTLFQCVSVEKGGLGPAQHGLAIIPDGVSSINRDSWPIDDVMIITRLTVASTGQGRSVDRLEWRAATNGRSFVPVKYPLRSVRNTHRVKSVDENANKARMNYNCSRRAVSLRQGYAERASTRPPARGDSPWY